MESPTLSRQTALLATLAYADIFAYPLTHQEIREWSLFYPISHIVLPKILEDYKGFVVYHGRKGIIAERLARIEAQEEKWRIAKRASFWLAHIPTVTLVGVTGGLAMNNAKDDDDIDLLCIVTGGTLWISRLFATLLMDILSLRRHPADKQVANKVCLNMFMAEGGLDIPQEEQDCFAAHEVLQMQPVWEQKGTYKKFLRANAWVRAFLPNAWKLKNKMLNAQCVMSNNVFSYIMYCAFRLFELPARAIQLWYMRRHRTHEVITDTVLRFHPKDARVWVKRKLSLRLAKYNIPLDKVFYAN